MVNADIRSFATNELIAGDRVTAPDWGGRVMTIKRFIERDDQMYAVFEEGGFWRTSQLTKS